MRQRISDKNIFPVFSLKTEYNKLHDLFFDRSEFGLLGGLLGDTRRMHPSLSYNDCLKNVFLNWGLRGSFTSLEEMLYGLEISEDDFEKSCTEDRLLDYIQFIINAMIFIRVEAKSRKYRIYQASDSIFNAIIENSRLILTRLGAEIIDEDDEIFIAYKDDAATAVGIVHTDIKGSLIEYLKIDNRGDLQKKGEVLCTLAKKLEPLESKFKGTEFALLCSDTTMLLNKIGARHAVNENDRIEAKFGSMNEVELEKWYDRTFQMFLACIAVQPYLEYKNEIKGIKGG